MEIFANLCMRDSRESRERSVESEGFLGFEFAFEAASTV